MAQAKRYKYNQKRKVIDCYSKESISFLQTIYSKVKYRGNPLHKKNPGDFGFDPPSAARPGKSLCDSASIFNKKEALNLLREGVKRGLISSQRVGSYPQNIWAVKEFPDGNRMPLESQLDNREEGSYHRYPLPETDPMHDMILEKWEASKCLILE